MLTTEPRRGFHPLVDGASLTAELMEDRRIIQGQCQAKRVGEGTRPCQCGMAHRQCLVRIAQMPQGMGGPGATKDAEIHAEQEGMRAVLLGTLERHTLRQVLAGRDKRAQTVQSGPEREM